MRFPSLLPAALLLALGAAPALAQDARAARLSAAHTFTAAELPGRQSQLIAWLDSAGRGLSSDDALSASEAVFYLIGSAAQAQQRKTGALFPARDTLGLAALYERAATLGSPGAALVAQALRAPARAAEPVMAPGGTMRLSFRAPEYTITSSRGWSIRFPFYVMVGAAQTSVPGNGVSTETVMLSTLFATDSSPQGRSQATILINAAAASDSASFVPFWLRMLRVGEADRVAAEAPGEVRYRQYDPGVRMHKELVVTRRGEALLVVAYMGLPGTFQANREEFRAVLASLAGAKQ